MRFHSTLLLASTASVHAGVVPGPFPTSTFAVSPDVAPCSYDCGSAPAPGASFTPSPPDVLPAVGSSQSIGLSGPATDVPIPAPSDSNTGSGPDLTLGGPDMSMSDIPEGPAATDMPAVTDTGIDVAPVPTDSMTMTGPDMTMTGPDITVPGPTDTADTSAPVPSGDVPSTSETYGAGSSDDSGSNATATSARPQQFTPGPNAAAAVDAEWIWSAVALAVAVAFA